MMRKSYLLLAALTAVIGIMMIIAPTECVKVIVITSGIASIINGLYTLISKRKIFENDNFSKTETIKGFLSIGIGILAVLLPLVFAGVLWTVMVYVLAVYLLISSITEFYLVSQLKAANQETRLSKTEAVTSLLLAAILFCLPAEIGKIIIRLGGIALLIGAIVCAYLEWKNQPLSLEVEILPDDDFEK